MLQDGNVALVRLDEDDARPGMLVVLAGSEFAPSGSRIVGAAILVLLADTIDITV